MSESFSVETFNAYKTAVRSVLHPHISPAVRGICLSFNSHHATVRIIIYHEGEGVPLSRAAQAEVVSALQPLPILHGLVPCSLEIYAERCDGPEPMLNIGCPIYGRSDADWCLPPEVQAMLEAGTLRLARRLAFC